MDQDPDFLERLNSVHDFPCEFVFKVIGTNTPEFVSSVVQSTLIVLGKDANIDLTTRESSQGNHTSVTMVINVNDAESVVHVFRMLQSVEGVRYVL